MDERLKIAEKKRTRVLELIEQGKGSKEVADTIRKEFGSGISSTFIYAAYHAKHGTEPHPTRGKVKKKKKPSGKNKLAVVPKIAPLEIPTLCNPAPVPVVDGLLSVLLRAMRSEGIDSVMIRADGRATVYHVVTREVQIA